MIAMQFIGPDLSPRQLPGSSPAHRDLADGAVTGQFQPLESGIVSDSIPAFFIGRNGDGFWVARDARGRVGGLFLLRSSALAFAKRKSGPAGCATIYPAERFELDLKNSGSRLVAPLGWLMQLAIHARKRVVGAIGRMTGAVHDRPRDLHLL